MITIQTHNYTVDLNSGVLQFEFSLFENSTTTTYIKKDTVGELQIVRTAQGTRLQYTGRDVTIVATPQDLESIEQLMQLWNQKEE